MGIKRVKGRCILYGRIVRMSYASIVKAEKIAREIEWLEYEREYNKKKVEEDFKNLMGRLKNEKSEFEKVMEVLKVEKVLLKRNWADMEEEGDTMGW